MKNEENGGIHSRFLIRHSRFEIRNSILAAAILGFVLTSCRTATLPPGEELAPVATTSPADTAQQLAARRAQFQGERSLVRLRFPVSQTTISARGQLQVDRLGRMLLTIYTPVGTTAARLYAGGDEIVYLNDLQFTAWRGRPSEFGGSFGLFGSALPTESIAMLLVGLPPAGLNSISYSTTGMAEIRLPEAVVTYDPPVYPPQSVSIDRGGRHIDLRYLQSYIDTSELKPLDIPRGYRCCVLPRL